MNDDMEILDDIPAAVDLDELARRLHMKPGAQWDGVLSLVEKIRPALRPKAVYRIGFIDQKLSDAVVVNGVRLNSPVLRKQLDDVQRVFPYVMTIGPDPEKMADESGDTLEQYYLDSIANVALTSSRRHLEDRIRSRFALEKISRLGPGSLEAWPISEQQPLFSILGDVHAAVGVILTESFLMMPRKSSSGIFFPTETPFFACQLCPREGCPGRKAAYDPRKVEAYGLNG